MANNAFKESLKESVPCIKAEELQRKNATQLLLSQLGLFPVPENIEVNISNDGKYLNLKLKEENPDENKHILYQFPLEESNLESLRNRPDYENLISRYHLYRNEYIDEIKSYAQAERVFLSQKFPELIFDLKIRLKSYDSYINKLNENMKKGKDLYINDIMAERITIEEYDGNRDEQVLTQMCDEVAKALYEFRINTNFRMKQDVNNNSAITEKEYVTKDYINCPKENGYQSLHLLMVHKNNPDFTYETQIRTHNMEEFSKKSDKISHKNYKPRIINDLSPNRVPIYYEITNFMDEFGNPLIIEVPIEDRFYHFYNSDRNFHSQEKRLKNPSITYKKFKQEQYELTNILGSSFKDIRDKLRKISNLKHKNLEQQH